MKLIFATTPYNIFNAILLKMGTFKNEPMDIMITDFAAANYELADKLSKMKIFDNVFKVKQYEYEHWHVGIKNRYKRKILSIIRGINRKIFVKKNFKYMCGFMLNKAYDEFIYDASNEAQCIVQRMLKRQNKNLQYNIYEVGTENYIKVKMLDATCPDWKNLKKHYKDMIPSKCYLHRPELCPTKLIRDIIVKKIPSVKEANALNVLNAIFGYSMEDAQLFNKKFIYFDSMTDHDDLLQQEYVETVKCANKVLGDELIVKLHPRTEGKPYEDVEYFCHNISFEILAANCDKLDEMVLISDNSTAALLPKLIYDCEPTIVQLRNLINLNPILEQQNKVWEPFDDKLLQLYRDKTKIKKPCNYNEFEKLLDSLKKN